MDDDNGKTKRLHFRQEDAAGDDEDRRVAAPARCGGWPEGLQALKPMKDHTANTTPMLLTAPLMSSCPMPSAVLRDGARAEPEPNGSDHDHLLWPTGNLG